MPSDDQAGSRHDMLEEEVNNVLNEAINKAGLQKIDNTTNRMVNMVNMVKARCTVWSSFRRP